MTPRRAFTLVEVMVALVVTGMVAALAYAASSAGLATQAQLDRYRDGEGNESVVRALLADALRHQVEGRRGGAEVFSVANRVAGDGTAADSLHLTTRGVQAPLGVGDRWIVDAWRDGDTLHLSAAPAAEATVPAGGPDAPRGALARLAPVRVRLAGVRGFDVQLLGRGPVVPWRADWPEGDVAPDAVALTLAYADRPGSRLLVRRGLERAP